MTKVKYTNELYEIDTPHKAYLIGVLYADGTLNTNDNGVKIKVKDGIWLKSIHSFFPFFHFRTYDCKTRGLVYIMTRCDKWLRRDLERHGLIVKKSQENCDKFLFPKTIPDKFLPDFIRGYFDGDGTAYLCQNDRTLEMGFTSTSKNLLEGVQNYLLDLDIDLRLRKNKMREEHHTQSYRLRTKSRKSASNFYFEIYREKEFSLFLPRKKKLFDKFLESF